MALKIHNAMWPGLVGKEEGTQHPPISLERMLELTENAHVRGETFDGVDLFLFHPHIDPFAKEDDIRRIADRITEKDLKIGSLVAPVWQGTVGGCAFGSKEDRDNFVKAIEIAVKIGSILRDHGARDYGVIRIDSAGSPEEFSKDEAENTRLLAETFQRAGTIAADHGESLAAEGEICWGGLHSWRQTLNTLEATGMPDTVGFQADLAHTYLYLLGYNAPDAALLNSEYSDEEFWQAYKTMTDALRPWTIDFHVAQNDGTIHGTGAHDKTGRHCRADDPNGKFDITRSAEMWLKDYEQRGIQHICWDGCMFDNAVLESPKTWETILEASLKVRHAVS